MNQRSPGTVTPTSRRDRVIDRLKRLIEPTLEEVFPQYCCLCGLRSYQNLPLCTPCYHGLPENSACCELCALPLQESTQRQPAQCGLCLKVPPEFNRVIAPWLYDEQFALLIHQWKFKNERRLTPLLAGLWLSQLKSPPNHIDIIVPVPLHWSKFWHRGYNQSELLAMELGRQCIELQDTSIDSHLVQRHRATIAQSGLGALARKTNLLAAFTARRRCDNLRIAIVDDVLTTGATATAMAATLRDAGASHTEIWCIARTPEPKN